MASQNRSYDPPIGSPPDIPPRNVKQVDTQSEVSEWGIIPRIVPRPEGGVPLQRTIMGKSDGPVR